MMQVKDINEWVQRIIAALPPAVQQLPQNLQQHLREAIASTLSKCDLVTKEEFDAQTGVLLKTRAKLEQLEKKLQELERSS
jgi:ubiquinone biosynthesis accessory factor UbiK